MAEFISSFITGFQDVVSKDLPSKLPGVKILKVFDGLIYYQYNGNSRELENIIYFNNTFFVIKTWNGKKTTFPQMVNEVANSKSYYLISKGTFRCRFNNENQFAKVDKNVVRRAEEAVLRNSKLQIDRLSPSTEIWYAIRREGFSFCGQLISKREFTEKNLNKGELRPEIAYLICCFANLQKEEIVAEPFCGYGSIPVQIAKRFPVEKLFVSDIDSEKISEVSQKKQLKDNERIQVLKEDAFRLSHIQDKSLDVVITDPPWGYYEDIGDICQFYEKMFESFKRVLKTEGRMIILSARKEEIEKTAGKMDIQITDSLHTLVNGKKAALYKMQF